METSSQGQPTTAFLAPDCVGSRAGSRGLVRRSGGSIWVGTVSFFAPGFQTRRLVLSLCCREGWRSLEVVADCLQRDSQPHYC